MPRALRFPRSDRLTHTTEFKRVREEGAVTRGDLLSLGVLLTAAGERNRSGFVTSRRIGGAVVRNRVRRRLREIVRRHQHKIIAGAWIVIVARPRAASATYRALEHEWLRLASRASILAP
jgi:ribonuclease P protein component